MPVSKGLKIDIRRKRILEILNRDGQVRVAELVLELGATPVTIRSDLDALKTDGYLERTPGGAVQTVKNFYHADFQQRRQENASEKKRIAVLASELVKDGETLFINSGTTTYNTAIELKRHKSLNIVTNSIPVAMELGDVPTFRVILLGGSINTQYSFTFGVNALEELRKFKADKTILSMDGIRADTGFTTYHAEEAIINRTMMERSGETVIVAEHRKVGKESFSFVAPINAAHYLVTDGDDESFAELENTDLRIVK
jgi:DeoR/GlpR family transcriptional regulator of sugar metabolism